MRTLTLAATLAAIAFSGLPASAMDNPVNKSRAKIEATLDKQPGHEATKASTRPVTASSNLRPSRELNRYERAHHRLFRFRSAPAGR